MYKMKTEDFFEVFNVDRNIIERWDDNIYENISDTFYECHARKIRERMRQLSEDVGVVLKLDIDQEVYDYFIENSVQYTTNLVTFFVNEIEDWFNNNVDRLFDIPVELNIIKANYEEVEFELKCEDLLINIGKGMDAYGAWDWDSHCQEDKEAFLKDGYLALREILHYYEACESKPQIKFNEYKEFWMCDDECEFWNKIEKMILNGEWAVECKFPDILNEYNTNNEVNIQCN